MPPKRLLSVNEVCHASGLGRTSIYAAIKRGDLLIIKIGRRILIAASALDAFIAKYS